MAGDFLSVERIVVKRDRLVCDVRVAPDSPRQVTPALAEAVHRRFPQVESHACVNEAGDTFGAVLDHAGLPHLLEHLAIQLQAEAWESAARAEAQNRSDAQRADAFVGITEWVDREEGTARIQLSYQDDLAALKALRDAVAFANEALSRKR